MHRVTWCIPERSRTWPIATPTATSSERSSRLKTRIDMASASATTSRDSIERRFTELKAAGRRALVPYITAGHPDAERTVELLGGLANAGADVIELGLPFSDPMADGPIIQASSQRALDQGMN